MGEFEAFGSWQFQAFNVNSRLFIYLLRGLLTSVIGRARKNVKSSHFHAIKQNVFDLISVPISHGTLSNSTYYFVS